MVGKKCFAKLTPETFLQTFASQSVRVGTNIGCSCCGQVGEYVEQLGLSTSSVFEEVYRKDTGIDDCFSADQYVEAIISLKNKIGGNFSRASHKPGKLRVINTRCPFGSPVRSAPELCQMTSSLFGGIAARNFGYAKVILDKRIASGDDICDVSIFLDSAMASEAEGDEYRYVQGQVMRPSGGAKASQVSAEIEEQMYQVWCGDNAPQQSHKRDRPFLIAESPAMRKALETVNTIGATQTSVLITGETGVGKEVIARAIHAVSERRDKPFIAVNCGSIPDTLIESAIFGHEKGAFTGAYDVHHGFFERAGGGTLFLDEIDSLPLLAQTRLLRVLQEGEFERVGGKRTMFADARIITAAGQSLKKLIGQGQFREDLYYRLNVVPVYISPLRERVEDIAGLVPHILERLSKKYDKTVNCVSPEAMQAIMSYGWPGNVRELENALERSFLFSKDNVIVNLLLDNACEGDSGENGEGEGTGALPANMTLKDAKKHAAATTERRILKEYLRVCNGNVTSVARKLDITRRAVHQKLSAYKIDVASYRPGPGLRDPQAN